MARGAIEGLVRGELTRRFDENPYEPQVEGDGLVPKPYLIDDAVRDTLAKMSTLVSDLVAMPIESDFSGLWMFLARRRGEKLSARGVSHALASDVMLAIAAESSKLMAEQQRRQKRYDSLRWPKVK